MSVLSLEQIDPLRGIPVVGLATVDTKDRPHMIPMCFTCCDGRIYSVPEGSQVIRVESEEIGVYYYDVAIWPIVVI